MQNAKMTYSLRRLAVAPPNNLMRLLAAGMSKDQRKAPLSNRCTMERMENGTLNFVILKTDAIYLMRINPASSI